MWTGKPQTLNPKPYPLPGTQPASLSSALAYVPPPLLCRAALPFPHAPRPPPLPAPRRRPRRWRRVAAAAGSGGAGRSREGTTTWTSLKEPLPTTRAGRRRSAAAPSPAQVTRPAYRTPMLCRRACCLYTAHVRSHRHVHPAAAHHAPGIPYGFFGGGGAAARLCRASPRPWCECRAACDAAPHGCRELNTRACCTMCVA